MTEVYQEVTPERAGKSIGYTHVNVPGTNRRARKLKTHLDLFLARGRLTKGQYHGFQLLAMSIVRYYGHATDDAQDSTHKMIPSYGEAVKVSFTSSHALMTDRKLLAGMFIHRVNERIPEQGEMRQVFNQLVQEEIYGVTRNPRSLKKWAAKRGVKDDRQQNSYVQAMAADICEIINDVYIKMTKEPNFTPF